MRPAFALICLCLLAACGVDGAPERPAPGVGVSGEARLGVALN